MQFVCLVELMGYKKQVERKWPFVRICSLLFCLQIIQYAAENCIK